MDGTADGVRAYHEKTKHHLYGYALGPGQLDWATQPDPFRRYAGARLVALARDEEGDGPGYDSALGAGALASRPIDAAAVSRLFFDSLALSAWKELGGTSWALRVNPSSGNLHPTEGYLVSGPIEGLFDEPAVCHYAPREHALEVRARFAPGLWRELAAGLPADGVLVGLTSILWREAWKYGERAYRYCQHDVGHAIAAVRVAAAGLGWTARLLDGIATDDLASLFGVRGARGAEPEHPDCVLAVFPAGAGDAAVEALADLPRAALAGFRDLEWEGEPNVLSAGHLDWPIVEAVADVAVKPPGAPRYLRVEPVPAPPDRAPRDAGLRSLVRQRRSAVAYDGHTSIDSDVFYAMLARTLPVRGRAPFDALPWEPFVHLALFVHRVRGLEPGLYALARHPSKVAALKAAMDAEFAWTKPDGCPTELELYRLASGDARRVAAQVSCHQDIAADGCFSLGMLAEFEDPLARYGEWLYPRLFWETGAVGQVLYLEAEAAGVRATGIGCFFDDAMHQVLGIEGRTFQSLYHFTVGGHVEDRRLTTLPAYG